MRTDQPRLFLGECVLVRIIVDIVGKLVEMGSELFLVKQRLVLFGLLE